jgi:adenylate cyclase
LVNEIFNSNDIFIKEQVPNIDAFGRFGINLILAGACETLKYRKKINEENMRKILLESMELMGSKLSQAEYMLDKLDALSLEPRYMKMIQIGQEEMDNMIDNEGDMDFRQGALIFKQWNEIEKNDIKQAKEALGRTKKDIPSGIIAIMFTDIVNSALIQQDIGDAAAQIRVRTHNRIVRQAIRRYKGFEIKHTGDGIMSCFGSISKSVDAAVNIQRELHQFKY